MSSSEDHATAVPVPVTDQLAPPREGELDSLHRQPSAARAADGVRRRQVRRKGFDRPRFLIVISVATLVYLFAPIAVVIVFSFNGQRSLSVMSGVSLVWYRQFLADADLRASLQASIEIALAVMAVAAVLGTLMAIGLRLATPRFARTSETLLLLTLVAPEIATAVGALLLFTQLGLTLSLATVVVAHITFSIVFVTVIVRSRLMGLDPQTEEAAMDLGCSRLQALRLVTVPLLWPAIMASSLLVFVISFDNFVTSYFTSGVGVSPLPVRIYSMIRFGVSPTINAVGTFMMILTVSVALLAVWLFSIGSRRLRKAPAPREE
jgi:spermidine/putrescine transport system permease protein